MRPFFGLIGIGLATAYIAIILISMTVVVGAYDRKEYQDAISNIERLQSEIAEAKKNKDWGLAYELAQELAVSEGELSGPRLSTLKRIMDAEDSLSYLNDEIAKAGSDKLALITRDIAQGIEGAVSFFDAGNYTAASDKIGEAESRISSLNASQLVAVLGRIGELEKRIAGADYLSPEPRGYIENAGNELAEARTLIDDAAGMAPSEAGGAYAEAMASVAEAEGMVDAAEAYSSPMESMLRWVLVLVPFIAIVVLIVFFYRRFNRRVFEVSLSLTSVKANRTNEIVKTILIRNMEKRPIVARVRDRLPRGAVMGTMYKVLERGDGRLEWVLDLDAGRTDAISYSMVLPRIGAGGIFKLPGASVSYNVDGKEMYFESGELEVRAEL